MNNKKKYIIFLGLVLIVLIGVSFAFFNYYKVGTNRELIAGDIYLNMDETGGYVRLNNVFPETVEEARARDDNTVTFTIDGRNTTTNKTIWYEIMLSEGDDNANYTYRIKPEHLRFDLVEIVDGIRTTVVDNKSYFELDEKRIWVNKVEPNTTEVEILYELRVWVDENVLISDTDPEADYPAKTWKDTYASVKVSVYGDFEEKEVATDVSCFAYQETTDYVINTSDEAVATCMDYFLNDVNGGTDYSDDQDGYFNYCRGIGTTDGYTFKDDLNDGIYNNDQIDYLVDNGVLGGDLAYEITNYDVDTCGTDVIIPTKINGYNVIGIANEPSGTPATQLNNSLKSDNLNTLEFKNNNSNYGVDKVASAAGVFTNMGITSVVLPKNLQYIGGFAFSVNQLTSIIFPENLMIIGGSAFYGNNLTVVEIPIGVSMIEDNAFSGNPLVKVEIKGQPEILENSFSAAYPDNFVSPIATQVDPGYFKIFSYNGTCEMLNTFSDIFNDYAMPQQIITIDTNSCSYTN